MVEAIFFRNPGDDSDDSDDSEEILEVIDIDIELSDEPDEEERGSRFRGDGGDGLPFFVDLETGRISPAFLFPSLYDM